MPLSAGTRLGPYEILAPIGAGGMGEVYKARDTRLDRLVAIKVAAAKFSERFEREARAIAQLNHPNICQLYDVGPDYLVMELVEGTPLKGPLPLEKAIEYAGQILDALDAAHKKGITHRDLKPANILVTKQCIKLLDFGLAKRQCSTLQETDATLTKALTVEGQIAGTLQYMSPEQLQGKPVDGRSDLFSFGCVLYEMLTGKRAFEGESAASVIAAILEREPAPLEVARPLDRVVRRALAKDPEQRFQTARDLKAALAWAMEQQPMSTAAKPRGRWWVVVAATMAISAFGGWAVARYGKPAANDHAWRLQIAPPEGGRFLVPGQGGGFALSPDGRTGAFVVATVNGKTALWVKSLDATTARLLPGTEGALTPLWSPDSKSIGFFTRNKLMRVELAGGAPWAICDTFGWGGTWSDDGRIVFGEIGARLLQQVPASGGKPSPLIVLDKPHGEVRILWPQMLPGGRILYWVQSQKPENTGVYVSSLARPAEKQRLLATDTNAVYAPGGDGKGYLLWMRSGTLVAQEFDLNTLKIAGEAHPLANPVSDSAQLGQANMAVSANGTALYDVSNSGGQLTWFDRTGRHVGVVGEPGGHDMFRISPDGRRVAQSRNSGGGADLWLVDVERGISSRFTFNPGRNRYPVWSPDNRSIAFSGADRNLYVKSSNGTGKEEQLAQSPNILNPNDWSRDGRFLLYYEFNPETGRDLWVLPMPPEGDSKPRPYLRTPFNEWHGRFSPEPNPHWVAYESDESGRPEVYVQAFPEPRGKFQISKDGGSFPEWGAGGRELFYLSPESKVMAVNLKLGTDFVEPANPRELFPVLPVNAAVAPYDAAPDGQRFLVVTPPHAAPQPLEVIVNWPALLKNGPAAQ